MNDHDAPAKSPLPAVVAGSFTMGLGVIRSLGRRGVPVTAVCFGPDDFAQSSRYATNRVRAPHPVTDPAGFVRALRAVGDAEVPPVLLPAADSALTVMARHHDELARVFRVGCGNWADTSLIIDKRLTYRLAEEAGVAIPRTFSPSSMEEAEEYGRGCTYPVLVKPAHGHEYTFRLHRKMTVVTDLRTLLSATLEALDAGLDVMLQEIIPGPDSAGVNYNCFAIDGRPVAEFTARKLRGSPRGFGSPCALVSARVPDAVTSGRKIIQATGLTGFACTEFKFDARDSRYKLMEVNGRHNLSSMLAVKAGVDFPSIHYDYLASGVWPLTPDRFREGTYWIDEFRDPRASLPAVRSGNMTWQEFARPYRASDRVFAIASWRDPAPFFVRAWKLATRAVSSTARTTVA